MAWEDENEFVRCPHCGAQNRPTSERCSSCQKALVADYSTPANPGGGHRTRNALLIVAGIIGVMWALNLLTGGAGIHRQPVSGGTSGGAASQAEGRQRQITYRVTSTGIPPLGDITYSNANGNVAQEAGAKLPWVQSFTAPPGQFVYVAVQNPYDSWAVSCEIQVDGMRLRQTTSKGAYVNAECSGSVPQ
jgi:hypothetical protein